MLNANASSIKAGDKVIVTQRIPSRVLNGQSFPDIRDGTSNTLGIRGIPRGTVGHVHGKRTGRVYVDLKGETTLGDIAMVREFRDSDFEKYFAEWL